MIQIAITDDHPLLVEGIRHIIEQNESFKLIATNTHALQTLEDARLEHADVLLLDINLPDMDGLQLCRKIIEKHDHL
ncbi:MAG: response regulator transcription factor, partial [Cyclobacteriaceae bacterium]